MKKFDDPKYTMIIHDDQFMEFVAKKDITLEISDIKETKRLSETHMPGKKFYLLMEGEEFFQVMKETREYAASAEFSSHLAAVALYAESLPLRILGNLYISINKPVTPTRFFNDRKKAEDWLRDLMK